MVYDPRWIQRAQREIWDLMSAAYKDLENYVAILDDPTKYEVFAGGISDPEEEMTDWINHSGVSVSGWRYTQKMRFAKVNLFWQTYGVKLQARPEWADLVTAVQTYIVDMPEVNTQFQVLRNAYRDGVDNLVQPKQISAAHRTALSTYLAGKLGTEV